MCLETSQDIDTMQDPNFLFICEDFVIEKDNQIKNEFINHIRSAIEILYNHPTIPNTVIIFLYYNYLQNNTLDFNNKIESFDVKMDQLGKYIKRMLIPSYNQFLV